MKKIIIDMINAIDNDEYLKRIYRFVYTFFIKKDWINQSFFGFQAMIEPFFLLV